MWRRQDARADRHGERTRAAARDPHAVVANSVAEGAPRHGDLARGEASAHGGSRRCSVTPRASASLILADPGFRGCC